MPLQVDIVTPERQLISQPADMVILPGAAGQMGIMAGHAPLLTTLAAGEIVLYADNEEQEVLAVGGGLAEVRPDHVTVLADTAERGDEIDEVRAEEARQRAEEALRHSADPLPAPVHLAALKRSQVRLRVAERRKRRRRPYTPAS